MLKQTRLEGKHVYNTAVEGVKKTSNPYPSAKFNAPKQTSFEGNQVYTTARVAVKKMSKP